MILKLMHWNPLPILSSLKAGCMGALNDGVTERCGRVRGVIHEMWIVDKAEHPKVHDLKVVGGYGLQVKCRSLGACIVPSRSSQVTRMKYSNFHANGSLVSVLQPCTEQRSGPHSLLVGQSESISG